MQFHTTPTRVAVIGGGPAGLMAAQALARGGAQVELYDAMASVGRKFLLAGRGGMNITHAEDYADFVTRYGRATGALRPMLDAFGPRAVRDWVHGLGTDTFVGTSGRVFPTDMKAAPLLRAWLHRLREDGVRFHAPPLARLARRRAAVRHARRRTDGARRRGGAGARRRQLGAAGIGRCVAAAAARTRHRGGAFGTGQLRLRRRLERAFQRAPRGRAVDDGGHRIDRRRWRDAAQAGPVRGDGRRRRRQFDVCLVGGAARPDRGRWAHDDLSGPAAGPDAAACRR